METSKIILANLTGNEEYARAVIPHLKEEYFETPEEQNYYKLVQVFFDKYNKLPNSEILKLGADKLNVPEETYNDILELIEEFKTFSSDSPTEYLIEISEKYAQDRSLYLALLECISVVDGEDSDKDMKEISKNALPELLNKALQVSFDTKIGHDYIEDSEERFDYYHEADCRFKFDLDCLNTVTDNGSVCGIPRKILMCIAGASGAGKSALMTHMTAHFLREGKNVLYISMEMSELELNKRIDSNLMDVTFQELVDMDREVFDRRIKKIKSKTFGKLITREYPTGSAHVGHFRHLLSELKTKKSFVPDIIFVDYLNICASARVKNVSANSYTIVKSISEELRGLACEQNVPLVTATQLNRGAIGSSDVDMTDTSDSIGIAFTLDFFIALIVDDDLRERGQGIIKILKNRFGPVGKKYVIGIDYEKMKFFNAEQTEEDNNSQEEKIKKTSNRTKEKFAEFKF